mmetsp:Transcript_17030/g.37518  ORF Transcript_17030/g.37518 Transcript_17030/m.37518 type:complete len:101 (-) Transcript_17030:1147-1449(-)
MDKMLILFETQAGFAIFSCDKKKLKQVEEIEKELDNFDKVSAVMKLDCFQKFKGSKDSLKSLLKLAQGKTSKTLKKFIEKNIISRDIQDTIQVQDSHLAK